jgi:hypothetical protein
MGPPVRERPEHGRSILAWLAFVQPSCHAFCPAPCLAFVLCCPGWLTVLYYDTLIYDLVGSIVGLDGVGAQPEELPLPMENKEKTIVMAY